MTTNVQAAENLQAKINAANAFLGTAVTKESQKEAREHIKALRDQGLHYYVYISANTCEKDKFDPNNEDDAALKKVVDAAAKVADAIEAQFKVGPGILSRSAPALALTASAGGLGALGYLGTTAQATASYVASAATNSTAAIAAMLPALPAVNLTQIAESAVNASSSMLSSASESMPEANPRNVVAGIAVGAATLAALAIANHFRKPPVQITKA